MQKLPGMRDLAEADWLRARWAEDCLRDYFLLHGYRVLAPPVLEYTELFLRKSGGQVASRMYTLTDPGGNLVSMRPEFTSSIMRRLVGEGGHAGTRRVQYCGPVFRYEDEERGPRQFTQAGAELLGASGPRADAEGVSLAMGALAALGVAEVRVALGDISVHRALLEACGLSDRAIDFVLESVNDLEGGPDALEKAREQASKVGLLATGDRSGRLTAHLRGLDHSDAQELLQGLLDLTGAEEGMVGQRTPDEVMGRLLRKAQGGDDPARLERGMEAAAALASIKGDPARALTEAGALLREYKAGAGHLDSLAQSLELLEGHGLESGALRLDFGLARELAYYTGIIFEVKAGEADVSVGGGGRYDGLARALGSPVDVPALGFAYSLESALDCMSAPAQDGPTRSTTPAYLWPSSDAAYPGAMALASRLRGQGQCAEIEVCPCSLDEAVAFARGQGYPSVVAIDADGTTTTHSAI